MQFRWMQFNAFLLQIVGAAASRLGIPLKLRRMKIPHGQEGLYFHDPEKFSRLSAAGSRQAVWRKAARAVRGFGPVTLLPDREAMCADGMERLGIGPNDWYVCLHVRTSSFHGDSADYRNAHFENYAKAIDHIIAMGGKVVRLGDSGGGIVARPRCGLIDYPNTSEKSELMDLYLIKHCRFYIGTTSGILDTAYLFQTPTLCTNATNFDFRSPNRGDRILFKRILDKHSGRMLHFDEAIVLYKEIMSASWHERFDYIENTPDEILDATREFIESLSNERAITRRQALARRKLVRKRLELSQENSEENSILSASIAFSRCHIVDSHLR